ncbi:hypothetical protein HKL94_01795 [Candidatus Parcubacteria bacterium]|nr:hypothetical protein [Candidatus Parcubacteria bacterium]
MRVNQWRQGFIVGILVLVAFGLLSLIWGLARKVMVAVTEAHDVQQQYQMLEKRKATLEANLAALNTPQGHDAAIRTAFGVARPGEEVIVVVPPSPEAPTSTPSWWQTILNWF